MGGNDVGDTRGAVNTRGAGKESGRKYCNAGVDIAAGEAFVRALQPLAATTARPGATPALGGFGGLFDLRAAGLRDPLLVAAADGVGTKVKLAAAANRHRDIGVDLVAMNVNDLAAQGAEPLFFLDYFATSRLQGEIATEVAAGIAAGCREAGCALIGGETAEMPGIYAPGDYDLAGFAVGAVERGDLLPRTDDLKAGDVLLGLASSGLHANGFSLVRAILDAKGLKVDAPCPAHPGRTIGDVLLAPTRIYSRALRAAQAATGAIKAMAHITGGGLAGNIPRCLPKTPGAGPGGLTARLDLESWPLPPVFDWLRGLGGLDETDLLGTFNCGIGMVVVTAAENAASVTAALETALEDAGETTGEGKNGIVHSIGSLEPGADRKTDSGARVRFHGRLTMEVTPPSSGAGVSLRQRRRVNT